MVTEAVRRPWFRRRPIKIALGFLVVILLVVIVTALIPLSYYAITPGDALDVAPLISVPHGEAHIHKGSVLLTDVQIVPLRAVDWLFYKLNSDDEIDRQSAVTGPLTPTQYNAQGVVDMSLARDAATIVGLRALGYKIESVPDGVIDYEPEPSSPASKLLDLGDVITMINATPTPSLSSLSTALGRLAPGDTVTVAYRAPGSSTLRHGTVTLGEDRLAKPGAAIPYTCTPLGSNSKLPVYRDNGRVRGCLGIIVNQSYKTEGGPFPVSIDSEGIIGPSAGLAFTLGLIEKLDRADLTGGQRPRRPGRCRSTVPWVTSAVSRRRRSPCATPARRSFSSRCRSSRWLERTRVPT